jgi:hypothetical protein
MNHEIRWRVNESLLQSYRSIFISSQAFLLAVGAILMTNYFYMFVLLASLSLFIIWFFWFPVVKSRHKIVDYHKYQMDGKHRFDCTENRYTENRKIRKEINKSIDLKNWRMTRLKLDLGIPLIYSLLWIMLILSSKQISFTNDYDKDNNETVKSDASNKNLEKEDTIKTKIDSLSIDFK